jgi:hypothetical protein
MGWVKVDGVGTIELSASKLRLFDVMLPQRTKESRVTFPALRSDLH